VIQFPVMFYVLSARVGGDCCFQETKANQILQHNAHGRETFAVHGYWLTTSGSPYPARHQVNRPMVVFEIWVETLERYHGEASMSGLDLVFVTGRSP
jgi:ribonuclease I